MKVEYSNRAVSDLRKIAADSRAYGDAVTAAVEARIRDIVAYIARHPEACTFATQRGVHGQRIDRPQVPYRLLGLAPEASQKR
jgi:plasmid stabilization system protein ParE